MSRNNIADAENFFETASKEELIDYLVKTIQKEVSKGDDADCDLVRECSDWLEELTEDEVTFTPEELEHKLEELKAGSTSEKPVKIRKKVTRKTFVRVALIAAVIFAISLASLSTVAMNNGYGSVWEYVSVSVEKLLGMNRGEEIVENGIKVIKNTGIFTYKNMDDLMKAESLDILYPDVLPDDIRITELRFIEKSEKEYTLCFVFSNNLYVFNISNYYLKYVSAVDTYECITINDYCFYYTQKQENLYYAILQYDGYEYTIQSPNYNDLLTIINNMKG